MPQVPNRETLIEERDFFLKSLKDLEDERAAGDIDETDYRSLKDDYTERAARTTRLLEGKGEGSDAPEAKASATKPEKPPAVSKTDDSPKTKRRRKPWTRFQKLLVVLIVVFLALTAGWMVSHRGNSTPPTPKHLSTAQVTSMLKQADAVAGKDPTKALSLYRQIIAVYPSQPQALTGEGWLYAQGGQLGAADADLQVAERADPTWDLPHGYRGMVVFGEKKYADAVNELQYYLSHGPDPVLQPEAQQALANAQKDLAATRGPPGAPPGPGTSPGTPPKPVP